VAYQQAVCTRRSDPPAGVRALAEGPRSVARCGAPCGQRRRVSQIRGLEKAGLVVAGGGHTPRYYNRSERGSRRFGSARSILDDALVASRRKLESKDRTNDRMHPYDRQLIVKAVSRAPCGGFRRESRWWPRRITILKSPLKEASSSRVLAGVGTPSGKDGPRAKRDTDAWQPPPVSCWRADQP